jgi:hypothetical protein
MEKTTLLTAPLSAEAEAENRRRKEIAEKAGFLVFDIWLESYSSGEITLEKLCRNARQALLRVSEPSRQRALGAMLEQALKADPPKRGRGNKGEPVALKNAAVQLARIAHDEHGHPLSRSSTTTQNAFERAASILADLGVGVTPRQVEDWYYMEASPE